MVETPLLSEPPATATPKERSAKRKPRKQRKKRIRRPRMGIPAPLSFDIMLVPRSHKLCLAGAAAAAQNAAEVLDHGRHGRGLILGRDEFHCGLRAPLPRSVA
jgi:Asp-tRNA(Asn)/Glu-tRNA(Gln) amidotransferase A subunit family amidase